MKDRIIKTALQEAIINIENSAKFTWETHEEDNSMLLHVDDLEEFCDFMEVEKIYPLGIGLNIPFTNYWSENGLSSVGFLYHDLQEDAEKWIHLHELCWTNMLFWFYDEEIVEENLEKIKRK